MPITNYTDILTGEDLYEGQIAYTEDVIVRSGINAEASTIVVFGRIVCKGVGDRDLVLPVDANSVAMGIATKTDAFERRSGYSVNADGDMGYPTGQPLGYLVRGVIGVKVTTNVTAGSQGFWILTPGGSEKKGQFRADANGGNAIAIANSRWVKSGVAGGVVPLAINLP